MCNRCHWEQPPKVSGVRGSPYSEELEDGVFSFHEFWRCLQLSVRFPGCDTTVTL